MNHSEKSTSEENLEISADLRHNDFISASIEKARYNQASDESFMGSVLEPQKFYSKDIQSKGQSRAKNMIFDICQGASQRSSEAISSKKNKKCSDTVFSPYDISFDDRISIQTMDSKQFSSSFQYAEKELIDLDQNVKVSGKDASNNKWMKDKNYFDIHIIEHENEQDDERESVKPDHQRLIELQNHSNIKRNPNFHQVHQHDVKFIIQSKQNQLSQLKQAYQETTNENEILKSRVKQLQTCFKGIIEKKIREINLIKDPSIQLKQEQFKKAIKIFRKLSL